MKVIELDPGKRVLWEVVDGPEEWIGTHVDWDLDQVTTPPLPAAMLPAEAESCSAPEP